jgi:transcriptional regulator with GAF, ATPase, and Fis domain
MPKLVTVHRYGAADPSQDLLRRGLMALGWSLVGSDGCEELTTFGVALVQRGSPEQLAWLRSITGRHPGPVIAVISAGARQSAHEGFALLRAGAADVIHWSDGAPVVDWIHERLQRWEVIDGLVESTAVRKWIVGHSRCWMDVLRRIVEVGRFSSAPVLLLGESGTGKELLAHVVHEVDPNRDAQRFVIVDCASITPELSGSEFFGHERGAFTGAAAPRDGAFALAEGGTLFLDEVGELPLPLQAQLLRVIQEQRFKRVGSNVWQSSRFRLVSATNRDLLHEVEQGRFRRDLYYRIAGAVCCTPALRERKDDVLPIAEHFLRELCPSNPTPQLDAALREHLVLLEYRGNVRELRQLIARISQRHTGTGPITLGALPPDDWPPESATGFQQCKTEPPQATVSFEASVREALQGGASLRQIGQAATDAAIRIALEDAQGNLQRAAQRLQVTDRALQMRRARDRSPSSDRR